MWGIICPKNLLNCIFPSPHWEEYSADRMCDVIRRFSFLWVLGSMAWLVLAQVDQWEGISPRTLNCLNSSLFYKMWISPAIWGSLGDSCSVLEPQSQPLVSLILLDCSWFTVLCWFQVYGKVNQLYIYIYPLCLKIIFPCRSLQSVE